MSEFFVRLVAHRDDSMSCKQGLLHMKVMMGGEFLLVSIKPL